MWGWCRWGWSWGNARWVLAAVAEAQAGLAGLSDQSDERLLGDAKRQEDLSQSWGSSSQSPSEDVGGITE